MFGEFADVILASICLSFQWVPILQFRETLICSVAFFIQHLNALIRCRKPFAISSIDTLLPIITCLLQFLLFCQFRGILIVAFFILGSNKCIPLCFKSSIECTIFLSHIFILFLQHSQHVFLQDFLLQMLWLLFYKRNDILDFYIIIMLTFLTDVTKSYIASAYLLGQQIVLILKLLLRIIQLLLYLPQSLLQRTYGVFRYRHLLTSMRHGIVQLMPCLLEFVVECHQQTISVHYLLCLGSYHHLAIGIFLIPTIYLIKFAFEVGNQMTIGG